MNKKLSILGGIVVLLILFFVVGGDSGQKSRNDQGTMAKADFIDTASQTIPTPSPSIVEEAGKLILYTINDVVTGAAVHLSFLENGGYPVLNLTIDSNGDGEYAQYEWYIENTPAYVRGDISSLYMIDIDARNLPRNVVEANVTFSRDDLTSDWIDSEEVDHQHIRLVIVEEDLTEILGVNEPGYVPGLYRGLGVFSFGPKIALAQADFTAPDIDIDLDYTIGDLAQGNMECGPTSVTNNLLGLAAHHGVRDTLPSSEVMIEQLKTDFKFGDQGKAGVLDQNYLEGKNAFMRRYNLPIVTTEISNPGFDDVREALEGGAVIEMDLAFFQPVAGGGFKQVGSHLVAVTGLSSDGGDFVIRGRDSATNGMNEPAVSSWGFVPKGGSIKQSQLGYSKNAGGATVINKIYVQSWGSVDTAIEAGVLPAGSVGSTLDVEMIVYKGNYYPKDQFKQAGPDKCSGDHYHKHTEAVGLKDKTGTSLAFAKDPNGDGCGFGEIGTVPEETVSITWEQQQSLAAGLTTP